MPGSSGECPSGSSGTPPRQTISSKISFCSSTGTAIHLTAPKAPHDLGFFKWPIIVPSPGGAILLLATSTPGSTLTTEPASWQTREPAADDLKIQLPEGSE